MGSSYASWIPAKGLASSTSKGSIIVVAVSVEEMELRCYPVSGRNTSKHYFI